jgi:dihydropteroate synthase
MRKEERGWMQTYLIKLHNNDSTAVQHILSNIDVEPASVPILSKKSKIIPVMVKSVKTSWANIIKQEMLASGGDAAISRRSYNCSQEYSDVLLLGTESCLLRFLEKMKTQPACFSYLEAELRSLLYPPKDESKILVGSMSFDLKKDFLVLGILNLTPDSFSDGGKYNTYDAAMKQAEKLLKEGANLIDIGGESTRPGAIKISEEEELERVMPVIESVTKNFGKVVSVDSYKAKVISSAIDSGVVMLNDISSGNAIKQSIQKIVDNSVSVISMMNMHAVHNKLDSVDKTLDVENPYKGSTPDKDMESPLENFMDFCIEQRTFFMDQGLKQDRLIFDPGLGFGLSTNDITRLIKNIYSITSKNIPVCMGLSRKSYIGRITGLETQKRDSITQAISLFLIRQGVRIFRTHDAKALKDVISFHEAIEGIN